MGPKEKIERLAQTPEDRVLLARVWERLSAGQRREIPAFSCFLSLREQELVRRLKNHGYSVYYLSNIPEDVLALLKERGVLDRFDGGVASCEVHINKPDPRIYQALLDQYGLKASECVFIDDNLANVQAAFTLGFVGIRMKESVGTLIRSLATCNVALR